MAGCEGTCFLGETEPVAGSVRFLIYLVAALQQKMFAGSQGKAMADQLATVSKLRLVTNGGELDSAEMRRVEQAIRIQLGLS